MTFPRFALCQPTSARVICTADPAFLESFVISIVSHNVFSTGSILPESFNALQACSTVILLLSKDSTHFFLLDTASKLAPTRSHPKSSPSRHQQGPWCSPLIALVFRRRHLRLRQRHHNRNPAYCYRNNLPRPLLFLPHPLWGCRIPRSYPLAPLTSLRSMTTNARVWAPQWTMSSESKRASPTIQTRTSSSWRSLLVINPLQTMLVYAHTLYPTLNASSPG
jgi:hypothetical protein